MKKLQSLWLIVLALVLLLTACGGQQEPADEDNGPDINYGDYVKPVTDRKVTDLITEAEMSSAVGFAMHLSGTSGDSVARYESADASCLITLVLENKTREEFDALVSDPAVVWIAQPDLGEAAYWDSHRTELIVYQSGYAVSVSAYNVGSRTMQAVMEILLSHLI